jgi:hypothetical protein
LSPRPSNYLLVRNEHRLMVRCSRTSHHLHDGVFSMERQADNQPSVASGNVRNALPSFRDREILAMLALLGVIAGLILPRTFTQSVDKLYVVWVVVVICAGLIQSLRGELSLRTACKASGVFAVSLSLACIGYVVVKAIVDALQGHPWGIPGMEFEPESPVFWVQYSALHLLFFLGTFVTTAVSALASRLLIAGGFAVFKFGPEA